MPNFKIPDSYTIIEEQGEFDKTFAVAPLERGYGITLGNSLRRVLLSSIPGAAIVSVRIDGALHEFTTLPGILEEVPHIILNLKGVRIKLLEPKPDKVFIDLKGPYEFTAADIGKDNTQFKILNPDHHIATLNEDAHLSMELRIARGRGYVPAEQNKLPDYPLGTIFLDAIFSPIKRVAYEVEQLPGAEGEFKEKLHLRIITDGSITPEDSLSYAAKLLVDHLSVFVKESTDLVQEPVTEVDDEVLRIRNELKRSIDELELSVRSYNCLQAAEIKTIADLVSKEESEMLRYKNFGRKSLAELNEKLAELGLHFGMDVEKYLKED